MAETLTRALHTPTPPESVSEVPESDPVEDFLRAFSTPMPLGSYYWSITKYFQDILKKYLEDENHENLIAHLKGPEQPALPLIAKSENAQVEALQVLLESGHFGSTESCDSHGRTALSHAAELQNRDFVKLLLQKGANADTRDNDGRTPLSWAATPSQGNFKGIAFGIPSMLMSHGAEINTEDNEKRTPLIWAIMQRSDIIINELLGREEIKVNCQDNNGQTPLILAAKKMDYDLMKRLIQKKADTFPRDADHCTFFYRLLEARQKSRKDCRPGFQALASCGRVGSFCRVRPLCQDCSSRKFRSFLETAFDNLNRRDKDGCTLLWWAVEFEDSEMVKALLQKGANPNLNDQNPSDFPLGFPFLKALELGNEDFISHFVPSTPDGFTEPGRDNTSLHWLIENQSIGEIRALGILTKALQNGYNANQRDPDGNTLLYHAIVHRRESLALKLIDKLKKEQLDTTMGMKTDNTPLHVALTKKMKNIVLKLVECGVKVDLSHRDKWFKLGGEGTRYIRFRDSQMFELIEQSPNKDDWLANGNKNVLW